MYLIHIYIYIYIERERDREHDNIAPAWRDREAAADAGRHELALAAGVLPRLSLFISIVALSSL